MPPLLAVEGLEAGYGPINVLHGVSLAVEPGEIVAMIGANGAGKTTTLMCVSGVVRVRGGKVLFDGKDLTRLPAHEVVKLGLTQAPEGRKIFPRLTVLENLQMGAFTRADADGVAKDLEKVYGLFPILRERRSQAGVSSNACCTAIALGDIFIDLSAGPARRATSPNLLWYLRRVARACGSVPGRIAARRRFPRSRRCSFEWASGGSARPSREWRPARPASPAA